MCSVAEDIEELPHSCSAESKRFMKESLQKCKKCKEKSVILLQKKDPFCKSCFFEYCNHKFRSTIGKAKMIKHEDRVLIAFSGGRKSTALLNFTRQTLESASLKQIRFIPGILFIDDSMVFSSGDREAEKKEVYAALETLKSFDYPVIYSSLDMVYRLNENKDFYWPLEEFSEEDCFCFKSRKWMEECFTNVPLSSKIDLIKHLRLLLMTEIAGHSGYSSLFTGDTASSLAVELLSDIALGRGSQICLDTSFYDSRHDVPIYRPLREFLNKEIALYNHFNGYPYEVSHGFLSQSNLKSSLQQLTETFISNLQENYPATVFTIFRTGSKLFKNLIRVCNEACWVCRSKMDNLDPNICSAIEALKVSERLSTNQMVSDSEFKNGELTNVLCHGCSISFRHIAAEPSILSVLPEHGCVKMEREEMKEEIECFLLKDDDNCS
ncbi:Cytoplasmic tRNA 2-thiolation protein 2 B, partial [Stegodyphus mimosarum]